MKIAEVGATGLVGSKMLQVLEAKELPVSEIILGLRKIHRERNNV